MATKIMSRFVVWLTKEQAGIGQSPRYHVLTSPWDVRSGAEVDITAIPRRTSSGYSYPASEAELLRGRLTIVLIAYLLIDLMAIQMTNDPYFILGPDNKYHLPDSIRDMPPAVLLFCREIRAVVAMWAAIAGVFQLNDIVQYFFLKYFFPSRADLWHYASTFGGFSEILDRGLAGWWGSWWHQTFRLEFLGPATYLLERGVITKGTPAADAVGLLASFFHSGFMHAAGSLASVPETKPWRSMGFFLLQAVGIAIQQRLTPWMPHSPRIVRRAGNVLFCAAWLYITAPLFVDDLSSAGTVASRARAAITLAAPGTGEAWGPLVALEQRVPAQVVPGEALVGSWHCVVDRARLGHWRQCLKAT